MTALLSIFPSVPVARETCRFFGATTRRKDVVKSVTKQTAAGLKFIHDKDVVHRDLKAENVLASRRVSVEGLEGFVHGKSQGENGMIWGVPPLCHFRKPLSIYIYNYIYITIYIYI